MISVIIPAYNEAEAINGVLDELESVLDKSGLKHEVIIVDDGSTDGTAAALAGHDVRIFTHPENKGYGSSLKTGIRNAKGDIIVITDADGTYPAAMIPALVEDVASGGYDMSVGARTGSDVNIPAIRKPAKYIIKKLADYLTETKIPDINSGLRAFKRDVALRFFHLYPSGFSFTTTITLALLSDGYNVKYTPINYNVRAGGKSKIRPLHDFANFLMLVVKIICYFNPLKVFLPACFAFLTVGGSYTLYTMIMYHNITDAGALCMLFGFQIGFMGLITDVMVRRDRWVR